MWTGSSRGQAQCAPKVIEVLVVSEVIEVSLLSGQVCARFLIDVRS